MFFQKNIYFKFTLSKNTFSKLLSQKNPQLDSYFSSDSSEEEKSLYNHLQYL